MGQTLHFQRQLKSLEQRIQWLDKQLIPYETKLCPTCESINLKALTRWEQKNIRERRAQRYQEPRELHRTEKGLSADQIINQIADAIRNQISQDIFISDHLKERALDISFQGLTPHEKLLFEELARPKLKDLLVEDDHFHLEFR